MLSYGVEIGFPIEPTKEDIKKLKRELAHDMFEVVKGGKAKPDASGGKAEHAGKKD